MDIHIALSIASLLCSSAMGVIGLYVGKAIAEAKNDMMRDAEAREIRLLAKLDEMGKRFEDKLDKKADKAFGK